MLSPSNNPHLIDGMIDTKSSQFKIYQDKIIKINFESWATSAMWNQFGIQN